MAHTVAYAKTNVTVCLCFRAHPIANILSNTSSVGRVIYLFCHNIVLNIRAPQNCVLSPFLFPLCTHDCSHRWREVYCKVCSSQFTANNESSYWKEISSVAECCTDNPQLSISKTKDLSVDFRQMEGVRTSFPSVIASWESTENLSQTYPPQRNLSNDFLTKLARVQFLIFEIIQNFHRRTIGSILTRNISLSRGSGSQNVPERHW